MAEEPALRALSARYAEFRLCREMGWTLAELNAQPQSFVLDCLMFLGAEAEAQERRRQRAAGGG